MAFNRHKNRRRTAALFDDKKDTTPTRRNINTAGKTFHPGQPLDKEITNLDFRTRLWVSGRTVYLDDHSPVEVEETDQADADVVDSEAETSDESDATDASDAPADSAETDAVVENQPEQESEKTVIEDMIAEGESEQKAPKGKAKKG